MNKDDVTTTILVVTALAVMFFFPLVIPLGIIGLILFGHIADKMVYKDTPPAPNIRRNNCGRYEPASTQQILSLDDLYNPLGFKEPVIRHNDGTNIFMPAEDKLIHLQSDFWKQLKLKRLHLSNNACECCGSGLSLQLHHIHYFNLGNENAEDVTILCKACHFKLHIEADKVYEADLFGGKSRLNYYPIFFLGKSSQPQQYNF